MMVQHCSSLLPRIQIGYGSNSTRSHPMGWWDLYWGLTICLQPKQAGTFYKLSGNVSAGERGSYPA